MKYQILLLTGILLLGAGCAERVGDLVSESDDDLNPINRVKEAIKKSSLAMPLESYDASYKRYGEYIDDRFNGYHVGDDLEVVQDNKMLEKVYAIADGRVSLLEWVPGYGGLIMIEHHSECLPGVSSECMPFTSLYGHVDVGYADVEVGDEVVAGQRIGILGEGGTQETDGERKHLHFAIAEGLGAPQKGYETDPKRLVNWVNPYDLLVRSGVNIPVKKWQSAFDLEEPSGRDTFNIDFEMPGTWDIEWIPSLESWNLYSVEGTGSARDRSQMLIRYFDASSFLTLSTVTIHDTTDMTVGTEDYVARRYDIEKKPGIADFRGQPEWRNERHIVTDFAGESGFTRYYVVAANPELDKEVYEHVLDSMTILE